MEIFTYDPTANDEIAGMIDQYSTIFVPDETVEISVLENADLELLLDLRLYLQALQKRIFEQKSGFNTKLGQEICCRMAAEGQVKYAMGNGRIAELRDGSSASTLDEHLLLEAGVDPDVIQRCRKPGTSYVYVQIIKSKSKDGGRS